MRSLQVIFIGLAAIALPSCNLVLEQPRNEPSRIISTHPPISVVDPPPIIANAEPVPAIINSEPPPEPLPKPKDDIPEPIPKPQPDPEPSYEPPENYAYIRAQAIREKKNLIVWVGCQSPEIEKELDDCLHYHGGSFQGVTAPAVIVSVPVGGNLYWARDFSGIPAVVAVQNAINSFELAPSKPTAMESVPEMRAIPLRAAAPRMRMRSRSGSC